MSRHDGSVSKLSQTELFTTASSLQAERAVITLPIQFLVSVLLVLLLVWQPAIADDREVAKRIHDRLTGTPATDAVLDQMEILIAGGDLTAAARYAIDGDTNDTPGSAPTNPNIGFYNVVLKNWAMPWTNRDFDVFQPLNDYVATIIGMVRDERDFREILYADVMYSGAGGHNPSSNQHYENLESSGANLGDPAVLTPISQASVTGIDPAGVAGIFTTRAAAKSFFILGTNRAMFRFTLVNHLCTDLEQLQDGSRPSDRIRQDVSRSPGGDSTVFLNNCVTCHSGMDPLAQAFAYYEFEFNNDDPDTGRLIYTPGVVQGKYTINSTTFPNGYVTPNDHWSNYWRLGPNSEKIGWLNAPANSGSIDLALEPEIAEGDGAASMGQELANTEAFAYCQVKKAFESVCLREPATSDSGFVNSTVTSFKSGYNMKNVFANVAAYCASDL